MSVACFVAQITPASGERREKPQLRGRPEASILFFFLCCCCWDHYIDEVNIICLGTRNPLSRQEGLLLQSFSSWSSMGLTA